MRTSVDSYRLGFKTPTSTLLLRDGAVYFVALVALSITNIVTIKMATTAPIFGTVSLFIIPLRGILISRFFLNLRHVFFTKDTNGPEPISSLKTKIPVIASEKLVGNLGAPLRSTPISGPSGPPRRRRSSVGANSLLDLDVGDLDDEEIGDVEVTSRRPILFGLGMDSNVVGQGSGKHLWRRGFDGTGVEGQEVVSLMDRGGESSAQTPVRSAISRPIGDGSDGKWLHPGRQPSTSSIDEANALLVDAYGYDEDSDRYSRDHSRPSFASAVGSEAREVTPRRQSYFS